jgi:hypothetical protein
VTAAALLADLEARDVRLWLEGGALTYDAPPGALTDRDREAVAANRAALVALLAAEPSAPSDSDSLTFDPEAPLVARLFDRVRLAWLRSARAGSAPEAGLAWLEAQARELAPDLGEDDLAVLATRALGRLCALSPAPGRDLAERAWDLLGGDAGRQEEPLPAPARPDLFTKVNAVELVAVVPPPSPPEGLPETCPACKSRSPKWKAIGSGRRFLCGRCWKGLDWPEEAR